MFPGHNRVSPPGTVEFTGETPPGVVEYNNEPPPQPVTNKTPPHSVLRALLAELDSVERCYWAGHITCGRDFAEILHKVVDKYKKFC